jgi:hypothetical protein
MPLDPTQCSPAGGDRAARRRLLARIAIALLAGGALAAQSPAPERKVAGSVISSERAPRADIELPRSVQYVGADRWVLYGIADCELHAFVDADTRKNVRRLFWVQFEGYLPTKPTLKHQYDSPRHARLGGMDFYVDTWVRPDDAAIQPGSDREHIEALVRAKGFKMPAGMMYVRLVHLLDAERRQELMIIYGEDLAGTGHTAAELDEGGKAHGQWAAIEKNLIDRATRAIVSRDTSKP